MKRNRITTLLKGLFTGATLWVAPFLKAQDAALLDGMSDRIERAMCESDDAALQVESAKCDAVLMKVPDQGWAHYYKGVIALHRATMGSTASEAKDKRKALFDAAVAALEKAQSIRRDGETLALKAAAMERSISVRGGFSMMSLGPAAVKAHDKAIEIAPENPRVWMLRGTSLLFRPEFVGGSAKGALEAFQKAAALFDAESQKPRTDPKEARWGHAEVWAWIGQAQAKLGNREDARRAYARGLELAPNFSWIKDVLLPDLERGD